MFSVNLIAQTPQYYNSNTGGGNNGFPFFMAAGKAVNWLIAPGELSQPTPIPSGMSFTRVYFRVGSNGGTPTFSNLQILMAQSTITTLASGTFYAGPWDTVYNHTSVTLTGTPSTFLGIDLDHIFSYDPAKSLIMFVGQCGFSGTGFTVWQGGYANVRRVWSVGGCPFSPYSSGDGSVVDFGVDVTGVGINQYMPKALYLSQNSPNPFNKSTTINYELPSNSDVVLKVFDIMGKEVTTLVDANQIAGKYEVNFDATNLATGLYVYQLTTNKATLSKRMLVEK